MSKNLRNENLLNELEGSAFFPPKGPGQDTARGPVLSQEEESFAPKVVDESARRATVRPPLQNDGQNTAQVQNPGTQETGKQVSRQGSFEGGKEPSLEARKEYDRELGLEQVPVYKNSFLYTEEEWNLFEDLKTDLRRSHSLKATKNDIARAGLHLLAEDYYENQETSFLAKKLRRK